MSEISKFNINRLTYLITKPKRVELNVFTLEA